MFVASHLCFVPGLASSSRCPWLRLSVSAQTKPPQNVSSKHRKAACCTVAVTSMSAPEVPPTQLPVPRLDVATFFDGLKTVQASMCHQLEALDGGSEVFCADAWNRDNGSHGLTRVLQGGSVLEKAGVNVSFVQGNLTPERALAMRSRGRECDAGSPYQAAALSFVLHCQSPFLPTLRGDVRVFATGDECWGGGGVDLTPFYVDEEQFMAFHKFWKGVCDGFDPSYYKSFSKACNDYFYIPFRGGTAFPSVPSR
jgi:coproporphyrinogen III oxidase